MKSMLVLLTGLCGSVGAAQQLASEESYASMCNLFRDVQLVQSIMGRFTGAVWTEADVSEAMLFNCATALVASLNYPFVCAAYAAFFQNQKEPLQCKFDKAMAIMREQRKFSSEDIEKGRVGMCLFCAATLKHLRNDPAAALLRSYLRDLRVPAIFPKRNSEERQLFQKLIGLDT